MQKGATREKGENETLEQGATNHESKAHNTPSSRHPHHVQNSAMRAAIEMHNLISKQEASIESLYIIGSLWTCLPSAKDHAFRWL
jgi:hypothetical protein